jgi:hypothetical protein
MNPPRPALHLSLAAAALLAFSAAAALARPVVTAVHPMPTVLAAGDALQRIASDDAGAAPEPKVAPVDVGAFTLDPPTAEVTPAPKPDEWKAAPAARLSRDVEACRGYRVREWLKIHCAGFPAAGVSLLAGTRTGVGLWVDPPRDPSDGMKTARSAEVIFPVRRGDGRLFQVGQFGEGYDGPVAWNLAYTISEQWIDGERAPIITVR